MKIYTCEVCEEEWQFFPEDYGYKKKLYPTKCPICYMSFTESFLEILSCEGIKEAIKYSFKRIK